MSYQWLRQLTRRDLKTFASNQEDRYVNIDPWECPVAQAKSSANAPLCTLVFGNGPQLRLMFRLCFDKDQGSKIRNVTMAKAWFLTCNLHPSWGVQLRYAIIIHEVSLRRLTRGFNVYLSKSARSTERT